MMTTTRYLFLPALVAPTMPRAAIDGHPRAYLAATLTTCFRGSAADPLAGQLREHALAAKEHLGEGLTIDDRKRLVAVAQATQERAKDLPREDRAPVLAEVVRRLLDDAPGSCVALDVCVREAVSKRYAPTPAQIATAAAIVEAVTL
jgi:hypothetical protein